MKITDALKLWLGGKDNHTLRYNRGIWSLPTITKHSFGETIFLNIVEMLTDIYAELQWYEMTTVQTALFRAWKSFVDTNGQRLLTQLYREKGFAVIGYEMDEAGDYSFYQLFEQDYTVTNEGNQTVVQCYNPDQRFYVLKSPTFESVGVSDHMLCAGYVAMIDAVLNGATTTAERLGAYVLMSPKQTDTAGIPYVLEKEDKDILEKEMQEQYGMLKKQKQIMLLPQAMDAQVVSLASVDTKMQDKLKAAICAICDRIKVPANQVALIDSTGGRSLQNGGELQQGEVAKYRAFRRLINVTFFDMATELGMRVNYTIENEPLTNQGTTIEQQ